MYCGGTTRTVAQGVQLGKVRMKLGQMEVFLTLGVCAWEERAAFCLVGLFL